MIEKRTMWLLESSLDVKQIVALFDMEKKQVICYQYCNDDGTCDEDDDWSRVYEGETFYNTEADAKKAQQRKYDEAREKMKTCMALIKELDRIEATDDFDFKREDYLGEHANDESESEYWRNCRKNAEKEASLLTTIARTRFFNVAGQTINLDEVVRIMWHENAEATLVMRDGTQVKTDTEAEYAVVVDMYGSNRSDRYMAKPY
jgi:hypothetical protein